MQAELNNDFDAEFGSKLQPRFVSAEVNWVLDCNRATNNAYPHWDANATPNTRGWFLSPKGQLLITDIFRIIFWFPDTFFILRQSTGSHGDQINGLRPCGSGALNSMDGRRSGQTRCSVSQRRTGVKRRPPLKPPAARHSPTTPAWHWCWECRRNVSSADRHLFGRE